MQAEVDQWAALKADQKLNAKNVFSFFGSFVPSFEMVALKAA
jgi:hypothetical protein